MQMQGILACRREIFAVVAYLFVESSPILWFPTELHELCIGMKYVITLSSHLEKQLHSLLISEVATYQPFDQLYT